MRSRILASHLYQGIILVFGTCHRVLLGLMHDTRYPPQGNPPCNQASMRMLLPDEHSWSAYAHPLHYRFPTSVQVWRARQAELKALAVRKYMDAFCVYFWASTSLLFTLLTFGLFTLLGHPLTPSAVFTSLALFNVLIAPLNSFPWVINGTVEGLVSVHRLQGLLSAPETKTTWIERPQPPTSSFSPAASGIPMSSEHVLPVFSDLIFFCILV